MRVINYVVIAAAVAAIASAINFLPKAHAETPIERGHYLVVIAGCNDCHTPGFFLRQAGPGRRSGGSASASKSPALACSMARNITPDKETGIGSWTDEQVAAAITTGRRPDGRQLAPIMNYPAFVNMTKDDVKAVVAYLRSIPAVNNKVPGPYKPGEKVTIFTFRIEPPGQTAAGPPPK